MERHIIGVVLASIFMFMAVIYGKYEEDNFVFHIDNPEHLEKALTRAGSLSDNAEVNLHKTELIVCGEAVKSLVENIDTMKLLEEIDSEQLQLTLCEASIEKHDINIYELPFDVHIISDSQGHFKKLQEVGYQEIKI